MPGKVKGAIAGLLFQTLTNGSPGWCCSRKPRAGRTMAGRRRDGLISLLGQPGVPADGAG